MRENVSPHDYEDNNISLSSVAVEGRSSDILPAGNIITCLIVTQAQFSRFIKLKKCPKVTVFRLAAQKSRSRRKIFIAGVKGGGGGGGGGGGVWLIHKKMGHF